MLPLFATYDSGYFKPRPVAHRAERLIQHVIDKTWHDPSLSDRLLQCTPLELRALCSKRPTNKCNDHLLVFEPEQKDEHSAHYLLSDEDMLKLTFYDALAERSIPNLVLPHIKEITIDTKSAATLLEERGLLRFVEESKVYGLMDSTSLDPLASIERDMIRYAPIANDEVDTFRILQIELAKTYTSVFSHHTHTETIPLECLFPMQADENSDNHLASRKMEHFLHLKKFTQPMLVYNCKDKNFTEEVLNKSAELALMSPYPQHEHTFRDTEANATGHDTVEFEQWQNLLFTSTGFSPVTYFGDVGEILPDFATESGAPVSLAASSSRYNSNSSTLAGTGTAQAMLAQLQHIHDPSMTRAVSRGGNSRNTSQSSAFMFAPHLLAHFAGTTQRLIDLESPWQLMPCQPRRKWHYYGDKGAQRARSAHAADVVTELGVSVKQLQSNPRALHFTSVYSSALNSHFLRSTKEVSGGVGRVEMKKERVNELQQFVETAAMNAIPDQDEENEERLQGMATGKRPHVESEDHDVLAPPDDGSKKRKLAPTDNVTESTDKTVQSSSGPGNQQEEGRRGGDSKKSAVTATITPTQTASHRHSAVAAVDAPPLTAHSQLSVLPALPSVAADPSTSASRRHPPRSPVHPPPSRNEPAALRKPATSFQLPSFNFSFNLSAGGEGGLVEQYLRLQRGETASVPASRGVAPAGTRATHTSTASRPSGTGASAAPTNHFVTPQRHPSHTDTTAEDLPYSLSANRGANTGAPSSRTVAQVATVTPARTTSSAVSATAISDRDAELLRVQQLAAHNITSFSAVDHPLTVLISESFLEQYFTQVAEGLGVLGVVMLDCPLQEPVSLILDAFTAVCVVTAESLQNTTELKMLVKKLSEITFKFTKIHVVVVLTPAEQGRQLNKALLTLTQAVSRFPAAVCLRQCSASPAALVAVLEQLCSQSLRDSMMHQATSTGTSTRHFYRPFLDHLQHCDAKHLAHCEYLQLFPTVNFHTAAALLYHHPLRELVGQRAGVLCDLFAKQYVFCEELKDMLKSFVALLEAHAGLQLAAEVA